MVTFGHSPRLVIPVGLITIGFARFEGEPSECLDAPCQASFLVATGEQLGDQPTTASPRQSSVSEVGSDMISALIKYSDFIVCSVVVVFENNLSPTTGMSPSTGTWSLEYRLLLAA